MCRLAAVLLLTATFTYSGVALAAPSSPPPGWDTPPPTQGGSDNECNNNPGCTEVSQPKGQKDKEGNNSPKICDGPPGQCK